MRKSLENLRNSRRGSGAGARKTAVEEAIDKLDMPKPHKPLLVDAKAMKDKLRENMHKPRYDVTNFYKTEGLFQAVARDSRFENITLSIISFNALWIAIDCDGNDADVLHEAHPVFIVAENLFCAFFTFELTMRFGAFKYKRNCLRDAWFCFDTFMVVMMIMETWVMTAVLLAMGSSSGSGGLGNAGMLRLLRLLRLSRMARMARLLRAMPELLILIKGMVAALRSVFFTLLLLGLLLYVFAILFRQLTAESVVGTAYFPTVIRSMNALVLDGILFDGAADLLGLMQDENQYLLIAIFYFFILLAALTVMNMLIGVLCEVVSAVAETEHEELTIHYMRERLQEIVDAVCDFKEGEEIKIDKETFLEILAYPSSASLLNEVNVDVFGIVDLVDTIFASESGKEKVLTFGDLVETMLDQRESNTCTVKDVTDLRKYVRGRVDRLEVLMEAHMVSLGRLMEKTNGLPEGTFESELKKTRQELDLEPAALKEPPPKPKAKMSAPVVTPPQPAGISDISTDGSAIAPNSGTQGNAVVIGRSGDAPAENAPAEKPETPSSPRRAAETPVSSTNEATPTEEMDPTQREGSAQQKTGSNSTNPSSKRKFQKGKKSALGGPRSNNDSERTPLAANAE